MATKNTKKQDVIVEETAISTIDPESGEIIEQAESNVPVQVAADKFSGYINTLDLSTRTGKLATVNAYNNAESLNQYDGEWLEVCDAITTPGVRRSRQAGVPPVPCTNTYLITKDGNAYFSQSDGIADSITFLHGIFPDLGKSDPDGCLMMQVVEVPTNGGNTLKRLKVKDD